ncbi:DUF6364 family protein [Nibrella saemangeumensis]|uniref:DUF6364 family protein n=1 Tax=Nibrella saemangeumensis TaxID=1084526 RepID=A0ABP8MVS2_9BACT
MDTKLTLKLNDEVIEKAKRYAASRKTSLSRLVENYLKSLTGRELPDDIEEIEISAFVKSMATGTSIPADIDLRKEYGAYLTEKYS